MAISAGEFPRFTRERASDTVYQIIRDRVLAHVFKPGERLDLRDVARRIGVSTTPVKEAINRLAAEGLVEVYPQSGTYVTKIVADEIEEIFEIRMALECLAAEKAIQRVTPEAIDKLRRILQVLEGPTDSEESRTAFIIKDFEFHTLLVELSGNRKLLDFYHNIDAHIKVARQLYRNERWIKRFKETAVEHKEILESLEAREVDRLVKAVRRHIERVSKALVDDLRQSESESC